MTNTKKNKIELNGFLVGLAEVGAYLAEYSNQCEVANTFSKADENF